MRENKRLCSSGIGGQAVMEGIMMRNKDQYAVAVRKPDKSIVVDVEEYKGITNKNKLFKLPFIRGIFSFIDSMVLGIKTLTYSADFFEEDEDTYEGGKIESWLQSKFGDKAEKIIIGFTVILSVVIAIALFMVLPLFIADLMEKYVPGISRSQVPIVEGIVKILIFIGYLLLITIMKDIRRTFMYHGAEHKCINCIETGNVLTIDNVKKSSRFHKRCGTSFILLVLVISIIFFMFINPETVWLRYTIRILLIPVIAGISYEFIRLAGSSDNKVVMAISKPGMWMQKITTKEPTEAMIEVAIAAVEGVFDWESYLKENEVASTNEDREPFRRKNSHRRHSVERERTKKENPRRENPVIEKELSNLNVKKTKDSFENSSLNRHKFAPRDQAKHDVQEINRGHRNVSERPEVDNNLPKGFKPTNEGSGFNWK